ncbi:MAG: LeuD/DmdB family oxidoreductase small subunit [Candidatus Saccharicenans sp.]|uniref:LeuD/DmdB family oxidoreductase small subunit n=1 Tax=Candidatus Saccharicenans sp. TaxID=2819258 RepID=UPI00404AC8B4
MARVVLKLGDDISTDIIYPGRFMATVLPSETPQYAFADFPEFNARLKKGEIPAGSVVVAGKNFGCGSSREQAASTLKGHELVIVARNFARIFLQNAINLGLRLVVCPEIEAEEGDELEILPDKIINRTSGKEFWVEPLPKARQAIIDAGGLIPYTRQRLLEKAASRKKV